MSDPFRGGGFGSVGMGPFATGGGGDSRYLIANDGDAVAQTRKYSAQIAWANGTITDDTYLDELRRYLKTTDAKSRERTAAQNELDDAVYSIGRNKLVRQVNLASSAGVRVDALRRLISYDRRKLATMKVDNEQRRELADRIGEAGAQIRDVRYGELVRKYNRGTVSIAAMLSFARAAAANSQGDPDHQQWTDAVQQWTESASNEKLSQLYQDYEHDRIPGTTVIDFLKDKLGSLSPSSPQYAETQRTIEDLTKRITEKTRSDRDAEMSRKVQQGLVSETAYLQYLRGRVNDYEKGTADHRAAKDQLLNATFTIGENRLRRGLADGSMDPQDAVHFYRGYSATMDPGSTRFLEIQKLITDYLVQGTETLQLWDKSTGPGGYTGGTGRYVDLTGQPGGTPTNAKGFASQFDGSEFAGSNCWAATAAMLAWQSSGGKVRVSGGDIRYYSGDRDGGGTYEGVATAYQQLGLGLREVHGMSFEAFTRKLLNGQGAMLAGAYSDMPEPFNLSNNGFTGPHSIFVSRAKKQDGRTWFFVMDPIGRSTAEGGMWMPAEVLKGFGWSGRANAGGGNWFGDVGFAAKYSSNRSFSDPPFQAFDTDADGNSTQGRGGGNSREEAGKRRDWSKGRKNEPQTRYTGQPATGGPDGTESWKLPKGAKADITDAHVADFLTAVKSTGWQDPTQLDSLGINGAGRKGSDAALAEQARAVLEANGGDARLAAIEWFTNAEPVTDTGAWGSTERFYANAVGTRLGYESIPRKGIGNIDPLAPPSPVDLTTPGARPREVGLERTDPQQSARLDGISPESANIGRMLLEKLGVEATPDMIRAVAAWVATEGSTVKGNNPAILRTQGQTDIPGQLGRDADGLAVFGSLEEGVGAWADEIKRNFPGLIVAARSGDPERFLVSVDRSGWQPTGYGGTLIRTWNEMPGDPGRIIIGGAPGLLRGVVDLRSLAGQEPGIAELWDVDPRDPLQMAWYEKNVDAARDALARGADTWEFTPSGGQPITIPFEPSMVGDLLKTKGLYYDHMSAAAATRAEKDDADAKADAAYSEMETVTLDIASDEWQAHNDALDRVRQSALGRGDIPTYINATVKMDGAIKMFLGLDPNVPDYEVTEALKARGIDANGDLAARLIKTVDSINPANEENPDGDRIMGYVEDGTIAWRNGTASLPPDLGYLEWTKDQFGNARIEIITPNTPGRFDDFRTSVVPTENALVPGEEVEIPQYRMEKVAITTDGMTAFVKPGTWTVPAKVLTAVDYRTAVVAQTGISGAAPGSLTGYGNNGNGRPGFDYAATIGGGASGQSNISSWQMGGKVFSTVERVDQQMVDAPGVAGVTIETIEIGGKSWYRIPGAKEWLGAPAGTRISNSPTLVLDTSKAKVVNGQLMVDGKAYDPSTHDLSTMAHWYGTDKADGGNGAELGGQQEFWRLRRENPLTGGGFGFDTATSNDAQAYLEGDISFVSMYDGGPNGERKSMTRLQAGRTNDVSGGKVAPVGRTRDNVRFEDAWKETWTAGNMGGLTAEGQAMVDRGLAIALGGDAPVNAGSRPDPVLPTARTNSMFNLADRLTTGVRTFAGVATSVADAQRQAAAARAAQEKVLADRAAAERARQAAAEARATPTPTPTPTVRPKVPDYGPKYAPKVAPRYEPVYKPPTPTPTPTLPPKNAAGGYSSATRVKDD